MDDDDVWERFAERAAICEHDGGCSREHAEYLALKEIRQWLGEVPRWLLERVEKGRERSP